jgi:hypothetical protein
MSTTTNGTPSHQVFIGFYREISVRLTTRLSLWALAVELRSESASYSNIYPAISRPSVSHLSATIRDCLMTKRHYDALIELPYIYDDECPFQIARPAIIQSALRSCYNGVETLWISYVHLHPQGRGGPQGEECTFRIYRRRSPEGRTQTTRISQKAAFWRGSIHCRLYIIYMIELCDSHACCIQ